MREIRKIGAGELEYPERLARIPKAPKEIYVCGQLPAAEKKAVAIVGARGCSGYGRRMAEWFGSQLAAAGIVVVSGMAEGIDGISQRAALEAGGSSVGVLGCGVDICYPAVNRELYQQLAQKGCLLSEYPCAAKPEAWHFPMRNRIISGLADLVLVLEAREKSGSLITADYALEQGKDVLALPGRVGDPLSAGCNRLIRDGAGIALSPEDVLFALLGGNGRVLETEGGKKTRKDFAGSELLTETERFLLKYMNQEGAEVSGLYEMLVHDKNRAERCGKEWKEVIPVQVPVLMEILLSLCIKGVLKQENGRYFITESFSDSGSRR